MKYTHLRPGNIVEMLFVGPDPYWSWSYFNVSDYDGIQKYPHIYRPIPLTEEWMVRFGFIGGMKGGIALGSKFDINFYDSMGICVKTIYVEYVHQLQNLYFELTNEELELK